MRKQWESGGYDRGVMLVLRQQPRETSKSGHWPGSPSVGMGTASRPSDFLTWQRSRGKTDHFMKDCFLRILFDSKQRESMNFFLKKRNAGASGPGPTWSQSGRQPRADVFNANHSNEHWTRCGSLC